MWPFTNKNRKLQEDVENLQYDIWEVSELLARDKGLFEGCQLVVEVNSTDNRASPKDIIDRLIELSGTIAYFEKRLENLELELEILLSKKE